MPEIKDDKSQHCIPFLLSRLQTHRAIHAANPSPPPFFIGLNGVQGAGKTVLVSTLQKTLTSPPYSLNVVTLSLDDLYLTHDDQTALARKNPTNPLLQHRGQPGTHDLALGKSVFDAFRKGEKTAIPAYDKSAYHGEGDRVSEDEWEVVNSDPSGKERVSVVIFEGWCVGFRAWDENTLYRKWVDAVNAKEGGPTRGYTGRLGYVQYEDVRMVNEALRGYDGITDQLDALIHIDAQNLLYVYDWRQEQERTLRAAKGTGMTEEQVNRFVDGYYPSYELFTETLREGAFKGRGDWKGRQLRLVVDKSRKVQEVITI